MVFRCFRSSSGDLSMTLYFGVLLTAAFNNLAVRDMLPCNIFSHSELFSFCVTESLKKYTTLHSRILPQICGYKKTAERKTPCSLLYYPIYSCFWVIIRNKLGTQESPEYTHKEDILKMSPCIPHTLCKRPAHKKVYINQSVFLSKSRNM